MPAPAQLDVRRRFGERRGKAVRSGRAISHAGSGHHRATGLGHLDGSRVATGVRSLYEAAGLHFHLHEQRRFERNGSEGAAPRDSATSFGDSNGFRSIHSARGQFARATRLLRGSLSLRRDALI